VFEKNGKGFDLGAVGIVFGVVFVIMLVWMTILTFVDDETAADGITWVG